MRPKLKRYNANYIKQLRQQHESKNDKSLQVQNSTTFMETKT